MESPLLPDGFQYPSSRYYPDRLRIRNRLARECLSEFLCTFFFMLIGIGVTLQVKLAKGIAGNFLAVNFGWGLAVSFSGTIGNWLSAQTNFAISFAQWSIGKLSFMRALIFTFVHVSGSFVGTSLAYLDYVETMNQYDGGKRRMLGTNGTMCMLVACPADYMSHIAMLLDQVISTGILSLVITAMGDTRNGIPKAYQPLITGFTVCVVGLSFTQNDAYPINPARDLGARLFAWCLYGTDVWRVHDNYWWVPILGPVIGGITGAWLYVFFLDIHSWSNREEEEAAQFARNNKNNSAWSSDRTLTSQC